MRRVRELWNSVWFSTWPEKHFLKYLGRIMGSFRTSCPLLRSPILMPGMALVQHCHPQQLHFVWDCCPHPCPNPSASQAVTQGAEWAAWHPATIAGAGYAAVTSSSPCFPALRGISFPHWDFLLVHILCTYYCIMRFIILKVVFFVTFTPVLHLRFVINHNCPVI